MTRVLFMHQASTVGGGSYCLLNVIKAIDKTVFTPLVALIEEGPLSEELRKLGVEVILFPQMTAIPYNRRLTFRRLLVYKRALSTGKQLEELLVRKKIDVLYLNNMMLSPYLIPAKTIGCKTIVHVREHWPLNEHKIQLEWVRKLVYNYCDKIIAINHYSASIFPKKESSIIYDWIDFSERYEPINLDSIFGEDTKPLKIYLFTGGIQRIKGGQEVLKVFSDHIKGKENRLLFMGYNMNTPLTGNKARLKKLLYYLGFNINELKIRSLIEKDKRIRCIPANYKLVDIVNRSYCMLSYFTIPHANLALAECALLGTPVIAAKTEESLEYSLGGQTAELFDFKSYKSFVKCVSNYDYESMKRRIEFNKSEIEDMFAPDANINKLNVTIKSVLDK